MYFKFSLIFVELYCLFVVTKCAENSLFDVSDVTSDASSYLYTTRDLEQEPLEPQNETPTPEPVPVKAVYTLARDFITELEVLLHKITQTFVRIGQKEEGQKTLYHIYNEVFTIASNEVSVGSLKYIMEKTLEVMQDPNASKVVIEFFEMVQELMQYDLVDWYFVVPFLYDINRHPVPEQILGKFKTEAEYILMSEERKSSFAAAFNLLSEGLSSATSESSKIIPITGSNTVPIGATAGSANSGTLATAQVTQIPVKQVTQIPVQQVEQVTQIPVTQVNSNQASVAKVTQVPVTQVEQVTQIPVTRVKSDQIVENQVVPVQVETVAETPTVSESRVSRVMKKMKSLSPLFRQNTEGTN